MSSNRGKSGAKPSEDETSVPRHKRKASATPETIPSKKTGASSSKKDKSPSNNAGASSSTAIGNRRHDSTASIASDRPKYTAKGSLTELEERILKQIVPLPDLDFAQIAAILMQIMKHEFKVGEDLPTRKTASLYHSWKTGKLKAVKFDKARDLEELIVLFGYFGYGVSASTCLELGIIRPKIDIAEAVAAHELSSSYGRFSVKDKTREATGGRKLNTSPELQTKLAVPSGSKKRTEDYRKAHEVRGPLKKEQQAKRDNLNKEIRQMQDEMFTELAKRPFWTEYRNKVLSKVQVSVELEDEIKKCEGKVSNSVMERINRGKRFPACHNTPEEVRQHYNQFLTSKDVKFRWMAMELAQDFKEDSEGRYKATKANSSQKKKEKKEKERAR